MKYSQSALELCTRNIGDPQRRIFSQPPPPLPALPNHWLPPLHAQPNQFQLPPGFPWWQPLQQFQQHQQVPKIMLMSFWPADPASWFQLVEVTLNCQNVHDVHL